MLSKIRLSNSDEYIDIRIEDAGLLGGLSLRSIDGLGPVEAKIAYSSYARLDGGVFHSARSDIREVTIKHGYRINYSGNQTVEEVRKKIYRIASPGKWIRLRLFENGEATKYIDGYVKRNEPNIFSKDPENVIVLQFIRPFFYSENSLGMTGETNTVLRVPYEGDVNSGFIFEMNPSVNVSYVRILDQKTGGIAKLNMDLSAGQRIRISTIPGEKGAWRIDSSGEVISKVIHKLVIPDTWPEISGETNDYYVSTSSSSNITFTLWHRALHSGGY